MSSAEQNVNQGISETEIQRQNRKKPAKMIYVGDSNSREIDPLKLNRDLPCIKAVRYNMKEMKQNLPECENPEAVEEIIFNVGVNDVRLGANPHDIRYNMFQTQHTYYKKFPNARQHICAIPPTSQINQEVNRELGNLAQATGVNFISTKNLCDPSTKTILPSLIQADKLHYTHEGIKMFARQIKRSIWSTNNKVPKDAPGPQPT